MRRTLFVTLVVALAAAPLVGWAQPTTRVFRIGYLGPSTPTLERSLVEAFREGLRGLDYSEGAAAQHHASANESRETETWTAARFSPPSG